MVMMLQSNSWSRSSNQNGTQLWRSLCDSRKHRDFKSFCRRFVGKMKLPKGESVFTRCPVSKQSSAGGSQWNTKAPTFTFSSSSFPTQAVCAIRFCWAAQQIQVRDSNSWRQSSSLAERKKSNSPWSSGHLIYDQGQISCLCNAAQCHAQYQNWVSLNLSATAAELDGKLIPFLFQASVAHSFPEMLLRRSSDQPFEVTEQQTGKQGQLWTYLAYPKLLIFFNNINNFALLTLVLNIHSLRLKN